MPDLSLHVNGLELPNPFLIASGPPGTNLNVIRKAFREGWGAVVAKTVCLDASRIVNVSPRYAQWQVGGEVVGWENIELISDRPFPLWLEEFRRCKDEFPDRMLIASIMEEYHRDAWVEIVARCEAAGVDAFELNFSCPHGLPERRMGSAMGEDPELLEEVADWVMAAASKPVWAKLTPNVTRIEAPARAAFRAGCQGVSAINTILSIMGVNLDTLRPEPTVAGYSTPGGYSSIAIRPIALQMAAEIAVLIRDEFPDRTLSAIGGIETGGDAAQFLLLGASTLQVCTGVMKHGYPLVHQLIAGLRAFMEHHHFEQIAEFRGRALPYLTTHTDLVRRHQATKRAPHSGPFGDEDWDAETLVTQSSNLASGPEASEEG